MATVIPRNKAHAAYQKTVYLRLRCTLCRGTHSRTHVGGPNTPQIVKMVRKRRKAQESALPITLLGILLDIISYIIIKLLA